LKEAVVSWNEEKFLEDLTAAVERFDRDGAASLCNELIVALHQGAVPSGTAAKKILQTLRRKCYFDLMERVAEALRFAGIEENQIRRQYAQSLIDQGKVPVAIDVLEALVARTADDSDENAEARGLLGRIYKQRYINAVNADPETKSQRLSQLDLQRSVKAYREVYELAPATHLWHGINIVALTFRARKDGVKLDPEPDAEAIAKEILATIEAGKQQGTIGYWDMATAVEASVALGDSARALLWIAEYVQQQGADAFELSSTERQLRGVWGLTVDKPPGSLLLPLLQSHILQRKGGRVEVPQGALGATIRETEERATDKTLEKVLGSEGFVTLKSYRDGLERCRSVAQVRTPTGEGFGTGFLVRGKDLDPHLGDEILLLTNAHVVSDDPAVRAAKGSLPSEDAVIVFEALDSAAGQEYRVAELLWSSPPGELDATLLRIDPPITDLVPYPIAKTLPLPDGQQKVYVIGHPGGRSLSFSLNDNLLLDYDDRLLHYRAPTEGGSSGSPVFTNQWKLIGLHHAGGFGLQRLNGKPGTYDANEGIQIQRIIAAVRAAEITG
jgi:V8-like Glu-specific endopeptidase